MQFIIVLRLVNWFVLTHVHAHVNKDYCHCPEAYRVFGRVRSQGGGWRRRGVVRGAGPWSVTCREDAGGRDASEAAANQPWAGPRILPPLWLPSPASAGGGRFPRLSARALRSTCQSSVTHKDFVSLHTTWLVVRSGGPSICPFIGSMENQPPYKHSQRKCKTI